MMRFSLAGNRCGWRIDLQIGWWIVALFVMAALHTSGVEPLRSGEIEVTGGWPGYGSLAIRGVPIARNSSLQAYAPGWKQGYFSSNAHAPTGKKKGDTLVLHYETDRKVRFSADETYRSVGDNQIERTLTGRLDGPSSTSNIEWTLGYLNAFALYGGSYSDGITETPVKSQAQQLDKDFTVIHAAKSIAFQTRLGKLTYTIQDGDFQLSLLDGRLGPVKWWSQESPTFWFGVLAGKIQPGKPFTCRVSIKFEPAARSKESVSMKAPAKIVDDPQAFVPQQRPLVVIPKPKKFDVIKSSFALDAQTPLIVKDGRARRAAEVIQREAKQRFGWDWLIAQSDTKHSICFEVSTSKPEGYSISANEDAVTLHASDAAGFFYGAQTLVQLMQLNEHGPFIAGCSIDDYPSLAFRGVHLFTGKDAMPLHRKLVERIFARYKFNHLVLEADYTQWETNPKLTVDRSVPKDQVREYVKLARENFLEPIPLVQSLGHAEWMFTNGQNTELAEDPKARYAYAVTNPKTYDFIEKIYAETLDLFGPKYFHIGHDEVNMIGGYPHREEAKKWGATKLFTYDVNRLNDFFKPKDVKLMLWGDMLLDKSESSDQAANAESVEGAKSRREAIPKDAIICDWHYEPRKAQAYKSLKVFKDAGFKTIACTWYTPENISSFARAAKLYGAWGLLQTTWAGYSVDEKSLQKELHQFTAYVLAAEYAWNADVAPSPDQLPYRADDIFIRAMYPPPDRTRIAKGFEVDLGPDSKESLRVNGVNFELGNIMLTGELTAEPRPKSAEVPVNRSAKEVAFLQACAFRAEANDEVGTYTITYDDAASEKIALIYGKNIRASEDNAATSEAVPAPKGNRLMTWKNPRPEKKIRTITFSTSHAY
ncbi:MAG TPA: beta-N-acetylhexosaminidase, partial [Tepidisphaeraceae bacterium]|nr:beta-N-acetylhexosaminidase [Tepidisphaeraceae bacterium]